MKKTQLKKALATKIHSLAVKSATGTTAMQNRAIERIATLLNQAIEAEIKQAYAGIASQVRAESGDKKEGDSKETSCCKEKTTGALRSGQIHREGSRANRDHYR